MPSKKIGAAVILLVLLSSQANSQEVFIKGSFETSGVITSLSPGELVIKSDSAKETYKILEPGMQAVPIAGGRYSDREKPTIAVSGQMGTDQLSPGMYVELTGDTNKRGKTKTTIDKVFLISADDSQLKLLTDSIPKGTKYEACQVVGRVIRFKSNKLQLAVPKTEITKKESIQFKMAKDAVVSIKLADLSLVKAGDYVKRVSGISLSNGEYVIREIEIDLKSDRLMESESKKTRAESRFEEELAKLDDTPGEPREKRSANYILYTDISDRNAALLLAKLETMHDLVGKYFARRPQEPIECYVVSDMKKWGKRIRPDAARKILEPAGITFFVSNGRKTKATVYSCDDHGVVQHEAVHAFCSQAFGTPGPVWYAEGMAEMGQYWKLNQLEVNITPGVIEYLKNAEPKKMRDIVAAGQITGDSWKAYAWRWALCHLLANNPNYSQRFKTLGMNLMAQRDDSFDNAFGPFADYISFEYDQFVENFDNGYRVDLCVWDWNTKPVKLVPGKRVTTKIKAQSGWQSSGVALKKGATYRFENDGKWKIEKGGKPLSAAGNPTGEGRMIGTIFNNFKLVGEIELNSAGEFVAPESGHLYLRCKENWNSIADNTGEIELQIEMAKD